MGRSAPTRGIDAKALYLVALAGLGVPEPQREYRFAPPRRWRFDFAWPEQKVAVEYEGAVYLAGRHTRGAGFEADCEKYNTATVLGWRIVRITQRLVLDGHAVTWTRQALGSGRGE